MAFARRWLPAALLVALAVPFAAAAAHDLPMAPTVDRVPIPEAASGMRTANGDYEWLGTRTLDPQDNPQSCRHHRIVLTRWRPATAGTSEWPLPLSGLVQAQVHLPTGILFVATYGDSDCASGRKTEMGLYTGTGNPVLLKLDHRIPDAGLRVEALSDTSVALVGQVADTRQVVVQIVRYEHGSLQVERMPDPGLVHRDGFAIVALDKDHLVLLGGVQQQPDGKLAFHAETYVLDLKARAWRPGPQLGEGRAWAAAVRLPDGGMLVAGGWSGEADPSRSTEAWNPPSTVFVPAQIMAIPNAYQKLVWLPMGGKPTLVMGGGISADVQELDNETGLWHVVTAWPRGSYDGSCAFFPFVVDGDFYAWNMQGNGGSDPQANCAASDKPVRALIMPRAASYVSQAPASELGNDQLEAAFLPASKAWPALIIGGTLSQSNYGWDRHITGDVIAIDSGGRQFSMPSLIEPRRGAQALRMDGGVIVVGGTNVDQRDEDKAKPLPAEWLDYSNPLRPGVWQKVEGEGIALGSTVGQLANGHLLELDSRGAVNEIELLHQGASLSLKRSPWPATNLARVSTRDFRVRIQPLADGRVVVAGGDVRDKIALWQTDSAQPGATDEYTAIGWPVASADYEIFDPASRRWTRSAASTSAGESMAIGGDGRVWKFGTAGAAGLDSQKSRIEVSLADGTAWTPLYGEAVPPLELDGQSRIFAIDGEIFALGLRREGDKHWSGIVWFNPRSNTWEPLLAANGEEWHSEAGRFLVAHLPNGKAIVVPGAGL